MDERVHLTIESLTARCSGLALASSESISATSSAALGAENRPRRRAQTPGRSSADRAAPARIGLAPVLVEGARRCPSTGAPRSVGLAPSRSMPRLDPMRPGSRRTPGASAESRWLRHQHLDARTSRGSRACRRAQQRACEGCRVRVLERSPSPSARGAELELRQPRQPRVHGRSIPVPACDHKARLPARLFHPHTTSASAAALRVAQSSAQLAAEAASLQLHENGRGRASAGLCAGQA